jgi:argininosuccinate synthase
MRMTPLDFMKIVLAYSGGAVGHLGAAFVDQGKYDAEMIAFCADIGQEEELKGLEKKALKTGASKIYIDDLQEEFARDFIFPMMQAGAVYENQYFLGTSIARPLIAKRMIEIARREKADAIAHGATGKGNDQVRFELTAAALAPELRSSPRGGTPRFARISRPAEMIQYCEDKGIPGAGQREEAVFDGPESPAHFLRGRAFWKTRGWMPPRRTQGDVQIERRPGRRAGQTRIRHAGF